MGSPAAVVCLVVTILLALGCLAVWVESRALGGLSLIIVGGLANSELCPGSVLEDVVGCQRARPISTLSCGVPIEFSVHSSLV